MLFEVCTRMCAQVYVSTRVAYTLHTCANLLVGVCGQLTYFMCTLKTYLWTPGPELHCRPQIVPLRAHIACRQGPGPKKSQPEQLLKRAVLREEECNMVPDACLTQRSGKLSTEYSRREKFF